MGWDAFDGGIYIYILWMGLYDRLICNYGLYTVYGWILKHYYFLIYGSSRVTNALFILVTENDRR